MQLKMSQVLLFIDFLCKNWCEIAGYAVFLDEFAKLDESNLFA